MAIFRFHGVDDDTVKDYYKHVGELAQIANIDVENFVFFNEHSVIIGNGYDADAIYVTVDWIGRPLKQEPITNHIQEYFSAKSKNIYVKFSEINSFLYLNGEMVLN
jgi:hypothetical protein